MDRAQANAEDRSTFVVDYDGVCPGEGRVLDDQVAASMPPYHASSAVQLYLLADAKKSKKRQKKQSNFDEEMIYLRDFLGCHAADLRKGTVSLIEGERAVLTAAPDFATSRMYDPGPFGSLAHDGSSTVSASVGNDGIGIVSNIFVWIAHMYICPQTTQMEILC